MPVQDVVEVSADMASSGEQSGQSFYASQYSRLYNPLASKIRQIVFGADLGQESWRSAEEQAEIAILLRLGPRVSVLDVACGAGGPSLAFVAETHCQLLGVDIAAEGIAAAAAEALKRGLDASAKFMAHDGGSRLHLDDKSFDAIMCIDSICHFPDRLVALKDWYRLLKKGGRLIFTDPFVVTGPLSKQEIDGRCALGSGLYFVPPGLNEQAIENAGLSLISAIDRSQAAAQIASSWHAVRNLYSKELIQEEGEDLFLRRQLMLKTTADLAADARLTRFFYVVEKL